MSEMRPGSELRVSLKVECFNLLGNCMWNECPWWNGYIYASLPSHFRCATALLPWQQHLSWHHLPRVTHTAQVCEIFVCMTMRERKGEKLMSLSGSICLISKDDKQHTAGDDSVDIHIFNSLCNKNNYTSLFQELYDIEKVNRNQTFRNAQHTYSTESIVLHDWTQLLPFQCYHFGTISEFAVKAYTHF